MIEPSGEIRVTAPHRVGLDEIRGVIIEKQRWLLRHMTQIAEAKAAPTERIAYQTGDAVLVRGLRCTLLVVGNELPTVVAGASETATQLELGLSGSATGELSQAAKPVELIGEVVIVRVPLTEEEQAALVRRALVTWYAQQALELMPPMVREYAAKIGRPVRRVVITDALRRWGTCTAKNDIRLNYKLMLAPPHCLEYVVAHEVAHLIHKHHRASFWNQVERLYPDWRAARKELRDRQAEFELPEAWSGD